jgi:hypothetical protein
MCMFHLVFLHQLLIRILSVNPMYYVGFSSCTIVASLILFQGFNTTDATNTFSLLSGFIVTFLGVHLLNISRMPETPLPTGHSTLEGGLMNPRLSLQGRMSLDGWTGDRESIDLHAGGSVRGSRHGRQSSIYRSQTTNLFNSFEAPDGDIVLNPVSPHTTSQHHPHRKPPSADLHELREADEWERSNDYLDDDHDNDDERTALRKGKTRKGDNNQRQATTPSADHNNVNPSRGGDMTSQRVDGRSPTHNQSSTDVRIS